MVGIREMFSAFEHWEQEEFAFAFALERTAHLELEAKRERERRRYRIMKTNHEKAAKRRAYVSSWVSAYQKRKLATDPVWAEKRRKAKREQMARARAAKKQQQLQLEAA